LGALASLRFDQDALEFHGFLDDCSGLVLVLREMEGVPAGRNRDKPANHVVLASPSRKFVEDQGTSLPL
jgi:hypothetical protein